MKLKRVYRGVVRAEIRKLLNALTSLKNHDTKAAAQPNTKTAGGPVFGTVAGGIAAAMTTLVNACNAAIAAKS